MKNIFWGGMLVLAIFITVILVYHPIEQPPASSNSNEIHNPPNILNEYINPPKAILLTGLSSPSEGENSHIKPNPPKPFPIDDITTIFNFYVEKTFKKSGIPGAAVLVVYNDQIVYMKPLGVKEVGNQDTVNPDTIFQIGSCTKAFTSAAIASLIDDGIMGWDERVREYYPNLNEFALYDPKVTHEITIRDLLCHRSGLPTHSGADLIRVCNYGFQDTLFRLRYMKPDTKFRSTWEYNNILYALVGECAARAAGISWEDLVREKIFTSLGMNSSLANLDDYIKAPNKVSNHITVNKKVLVVPPSPDTAFIGPAGIISSSIRDMASWVRFQLNNGNLNGQQIVSSPSIAETHTPQIARKTPAGVILAWYGLGWGITPLYGEKFLDHTGGAFSASSYISLLPSKNLGIVVLSNEAPYGGVFNAAIVSTFYDLILKGAPQADYWSLGKKELEYYLTHPIDPYEHLPDPPQHPTPSQPLDTYTGKYYSDYYGTFKIVRNGSLLQLYPGKNPLPLTLTHWSGNVFKEISTNTAANFTVKNGTVKQLHLRMLDYSGSNGTFNRT